MAAPVSHPSSKPDATAPTLAGFFLIILPAFGFVTIVACLVKLGAL